MMNYPEEDGSFPHMAGATVMWSSALDLMQKAAP